MMPEENNRWAVLIGIDGYLGRPLKGCVNDVEMMRGYLEDSVPPVRVRALTAPTSPDTGNPPAQEDPTQLPTFSNIRNTLEQVLQISKAGDLIYVHFSGHGARLQRPELKEGDRNSGSVALVVLDDSGTGYIELNGLFLAFMLKRMAEKGLRVTLVLDCCFSGHVFRHGEATETAIRTWTDDLTIATSYEETEGYEEFLPSCFTRDARSLPSWLVDPEGYTIITACGPHEAAQEMEDANGKVFGVLSFYLHETLAMLERHALQTFHDTLYGHLVAMVHDKWPKQTPMCYGRNKFSFFREILAGPASSNIMAISNNKKLVLEAGQAHGVYEGQEYTIHPFWTVKNDHDHSQKILFKAKVSFVGSITSVLEPMIPFPSLNTGSMSWNAKPTPHFSTSRTLVGLLPSVTNHLAISSAVNESHSFGIVHKLSGSEHCSFFVACHRDRFYEILDADQKGLPGITPIPLAGNDSLGHLLDRLEHLAKYNSFKLNRLPSSDSDLLESFIITLSDVDIKEHDPGQIIEMQNEQRLNLITKNLGTEDTLYVTVLNFTPSWEIQYLSGDIGGNGFDIIPKKNLRLFLTGVSNIPFTMVVPEHLKCEGQCEDTIKIIVTRKPTSFESWILPSLSDALRTRSSDLPPTPIPTQEGFLYLDQVAAFTIKIRTHC
jgi:hypothetical protein